MLESILGAERREFQSLRPDHFFQNCSIHLGFTQISGSAQGVIGLLKIGSRPSDPAFAAPTFPKIRLRSFERAGLEQKPTREFESPR